MRSVAAVSVTRGAGGGQLAVTAVAVPGVPGLRDSPPPNSKPAVPELAPN